MNADKNNAMPFEVKDALKDESPAMQQELNRVWDLVGSSAQSAQVAPSSEKMEMLANLRQQIGADVNRPALSVVAGKNLKNVANDRPAATPRTLKLVNTRRWMAIAASFTVLMLSGYIFWTTPVTMHAPNGELAVVNLPDGSTVELNSGSSVTYRRGFGAFPFTKADTRDVKLTGEAYFKIVKTGTSFNVTTFNANIGVLGTQFNVRAWEDIEDNTTITLASGIVEVAALSNPERTTLLSEPGDRLVVKEETPVPDAPEQTDVTSELLWRNAGFAANKESLRAVFAELERKYNVEILVKNENALFDSLTIMLPRPGTIETILNDICTSKSLSYRLTSRGYEIY